jgi:hypothetical protein
MEKDIKVYRGDGKEVIISDKEINIKGSNPSILVFEEAQGLMWDHEGIRPIQETFSINPQMLRHTREAADVPEEVKEQYIEVLGAELSKTPEFKDYSNLEKTASFLNKEGLE